MRVRGLKLKADGGQDFTNKSHPMRVRGLKLPEMTWGEFRESVAPHAGAWIETMFLDELKPETL